jgi:hypothetical protein
MSQNVLYYQEINHLAILGCPFRPNEQSQIAGTKRRFFSRRQPLYPRTEARMLFFLQGERTVWHLEGGIRGYPFPGLKLSRETRKRFERKKPWGWTKKPTATAVGFS